MTIKDQIQDYRKTIKRWGRIADRWIRRAEFWKWLYDHNLFKNKSLALNQRCVKEAEAFLIGYAKLCEKIIDLLSEADIVKEES